MMFALESFTEELWSFFISDSVAVTDWDGVINETMWVGEWDVLFETVNLNAAVSISVEPSFVKSADLCTFIRFETFFYESWRNIELSSP